MLSRLVGTFFILPICIDLKIETKHDSTFYIKESMSLFIEVYTIWLFFFIFMPFLIGSFGIGLFPLLSRDMAFSRLNNLSFWLLPPSLILLIIRILIDSEIGLDLGIFRISMAGSSRIGGSINFLCTIIDSLCLSFNNFYRFYDFNTLIFIFFLFFFTTIGVVFIFDLYLLLIIEGGSGRGPNRGGPSFSFNNPTQPPKGPNGGDPSGGSGGLKYEELKKNLKELNEKLIKEDENKENMRRDKKEDSVSSSSSEKRRKHGSEERLILKDKVNKKKKCNII